MRLNIFRSAAALAMVGVLFAAGTLAYLGFPTFGSESEFTTLAQSNNLRIRDKDEDWTTDPENLTASLYVVGWMPGDTYRGWISLSNWGSDTLNSIIMEWRATDSGGILTEPEREAEGDSSVDDLSTQIIVENVLYGPVDNLYDITENIKDNLGVSELTVNVLDQEVIDLEEMLPPSEAGMEVNEVENLVMDFLFNPDAGNEYQGDNCVVDIIFYASTETPNDPPIADAGGPYSVRGGNSILLDGTGSSDDEGDEFSYSWRILNDPTGGATLSAVDTATPAFTAPTVSSSKDVRVELAVEDDRERSTSDTAIVTVRPKTPPTPPLVNESPIAEFSYSPSEPEVGESVTFDAFGSSDPDGSIVSYEWAFGDGSIGSGISPTHIYTENGTFEATLIVTDDDGATSTASENIGVSPSISPAPTPIAEFEVSDLIVEPGEVASDEEVTISVTVTNVGEVSGTYTTQPTVLGGDPDPQDVTLSPAESENVSFVVSRSEPGDYDVSIEDLLGSFRVMTDVVPTPFPTIPVVLFALPFLLFAILLGYTRREKGED